MRLGIQEHQGQAEVDLYGRRRGLADDCYLYLLLLHLRASLDDIHLVAAVRVEAFFFQRKPAWKLL